MTQTEKTLIYLAAAVLCALMSAVVDVRTRRIPNLITFPALLAALLLHLTLDGWKGLLSALGAGLICGVVFLIFYLAGGMGAGDVKLIAAVGALGGLTNCGSVLLFTSLAGGIMGLVVAVSRGRLRQILSNVKAIAGHHQQNGLTPHANINVTNDKMLRLPYALAIAAGCSVTLFMFGTQR